MTAATGATDMLARIRGIADSRYAVYAGLALAFVIGGLAQPAILSLPFVLNLTRQAAPLGIVVVGQTATLIGRSFDLSVGGVIAVVNVLVASRALSAGPAASAVAVAFLAGGAVGGLNGVGIAWRGIPPFIMTLGMSIVLTGFSLVISRGAPGGTIPSAIVWLGTGRIVGIPVATWLWAAVIVVASLGLRRTVFGRSLYAAGGNPEAARVTGVPLARVLVITHVASGVTAALGGLVLSGYIGTGALDLGNDYMLNSLAAAVLGGVTFEGGRGSIVNAAAGALLLMLLLGLLTMVGIGQAGKLMIQGAVIVGAVALYGLQPRG